MTATAASAATAAAATTGMAPSSSAEAETAPAPARVEEQPIIKYPGWDQPTAPWTTTVPPNSLLLPLLLHTGRRPGCLRVLVGALVVAGYAALVATDRLRWWAGFFFLPPALALIAYSYQALRPRQDWENPQVFQRNRRPAHAPLAYHRSIAAARGNRATPGGPWARARVVSLNGEWRFRCYPTIAAVPPDFPCPRAYPPRTQAWDAIPVPADWQLQWDAQGQPKYDVPIYTNFRYPIPLHPPYVPAANPTGCYLREFAPPPAFFAAAAGARRLHLVFHGYSSALSVWVNGEEVGYSQDGRLAAEFDVTPFVHATPGKANLLAVRVLRWSDGSYLEDQDHWRLSGLERDVELVYVEGLGPAGHVIRDYTVTSALDSHYQDGTLDVTAHIGRLLPSTPSTAYHLEALLYEGDAPDAPLVAKAAAVAQSPSQEGQGETEEAVALSLPVQRPRRWTAETPQLYTLVLALRVGEEVQAESCRVGFRTVEIKDGALLVNGAAVILAGVNRHEHDPKKGKVIDEPSMVRDILLLKRHNFNAVRNSHYPHHPRWYELCDEYGLYVIDEANLETHGMKPMGRVSSDPDWEAAYVDRAVRMVQSHRNHPSIIVWSLGNEAGDGVNLQAAQRAVKRLDPSRPVQYEGGGADMCGTGRTSLTDIQCPMYPVPRAAAQMGLSAADARPVVLCEYSHAMGNSNGNLHKYWEAVRANPRRFQGGFIWDFIDQGILRTDPTTKRPYWAYGGDFGPCTPCEGHGQFCINGIAFPDRRPHPAMAEAKHLQSPVNFTLKPATPALTLAVENRYGFLPLDHLTFTWALKSDAGGSLASGALAVPPGLAPGGVAEVPVLSAEALRAALAAGGGGGGGGDSEAAAGTTTMTPKKTLSSSSLSSPSKWLKRSGSKGSGSGGGGGGGDSSNGGRSSSSTNLLLLLGSGKKDGAAGGGCSAVWLEATATLAAAQPWAPQGHVIAHQAFPIPLPLPPAAAAPAIPAPTPAMPPLTLASAPAPAAAAGEDPAVFAVRGPDVIVAVGKRTGRLLRYEVKGQARVVGAVDPTPALVRACTDNDRAGFPVSATFVTPKWLCDLLEPYAPWAMLSYHARWRRLGLTLDGLRTAVHSVTASAPCPQRVEIQVHATVSCHPAPAARGSGHNKAKAAAKTKGKTSGTPLLEVRTTYVVYGSGDVRIQLQAASLYGAQHRPQPLHLPRLGLALQLPKAFSQATWLGLGPHECYADRKAGARLGVHSAAVPDLYTPYVVPSENGGRADTRWAALQDPSTGSGLLLRCAPAPVAPESVAAAAAEARALGAGAGQSAVPGRFQFNAGMHSVGEVEAAGHVHDLKEWKDAEAVHVHVDHLHMGVGGDNTWEPDLVHPEYLIPAVGSWRFEVCLSPLEPGEEPHAKALRALEN